MEPARQENGGMSKPPAKPPRMPAGASARTNPPLWVGAWIRRMRAKPADVARQSGVNEGYISEISKFDGKPFDKAVSPSILKKIGDVIGISPAAFFAPPPDQDAIDQLRNLPPEVLAKLLSR
jgi:hypothetical protein